MDKSLILPTVFFGLGAIVVARWAFGGKSVARSVHAATASAPLVLRPTLSVATWNISAVNTNPFEYWITHEDPSYTQLMQGVQQTVDSPGAADIPISQILTLSMLDKLRNRMQNDAKFSGVEEAMALWAKEYGERKIISGFLSDALVGSKRLISMPDRVTNTLSTGEDGSPAVCRPSVINCYEGDMSSVEVWWDKWLAYMFDGPASLDAKCEKKMWSNLQKIKKAKYPDVTEEEEKLSLPLQTIALAAFDAILLHLMNSCQQPGATPWGSIKQQLCEALVKNKDTRTIQILSQNYKSQDVVFLQEAAMRFAMRVSNHPDLSQFWVLVPSNPDTARNQNSLVLVSRERFPEAGIFASTSERKCRDVTDQVLRLLPADAKVPVETGDLFVCLATDVNGNDYVLASFHGDTNGLATIPVVTAVHRYTQNRKTAGFGHKLIFGLDANSYTKGSSKCLGMTEFAASFTSLGMNSCWGTTLAANNFTTFTARTIVQPQLNKAIRMNDIKTKGDRRLCDYVLVYADQFAASPGVKDNTATQPARYDPDMVFPTLTFPSDHGVVATELTPVQASAPIPAAIVGAL